MPVFPFRSRYARRFDALVRPQMDGMYAFAIRLTGQPADAEDLVQDVLAKLYPRLTELEQVDHLGAWLSRVLYRQFIDGTRRRQRRPEDLASDVGEAVMQAQEPAGDGELEPDRALSREQLESRMDQLMADLPAERRALLLLHDVDGWRLEDLSEVMDLPVGTLKSRLHRTRAKLREQLVNDGRAFGQDAMEPDCSRQRSDKSEGAETPDEL